MAPKHTAAKDLKQETLRSEGIDRGNRDAPPRIATQDQDDSRLKLLLWYLRLHLAGTIHGFLEATHGFVIHQKTHEPELVAFN